MLERNISRWLQARKEPQIGSYVRWLMEQRYLVANPFAGTEVRGGAGLSVLDATPAFSEGEWALVQAVAEGLEWGHGWTQPAAQRLGFVLDVGYATGLRASELVGVTLGQLRVDGHGDWWLYVVGKGSKPGKVALPPLARTALDRYLVQRGLPTPVTHWDPRTPLLASLEAEGAGAGISSSRLWMVVWRFFALAAAVVEADAPAVSEKLRRASPHWMRYTHGSHALDRGAEITAVRDNLRHASISTTTIYLHADDVKRARQFGAAFPASQE